MPDDAASGLGNAIIFALVRRAASRQRDSTKESQISSPVASALCSGLLPAIDTLELKN
jgi:hypothetical protein